MGEERNEACNEKSS